MNIFTFDQLYKLLIGNFFVQFKSFTIVIRFQVLVLFINKFLQENTFKYKLNTYNYVSVKRYFVYNISYYKSL